MKMYLVAIVVALIGLWISSEIRAAELCRLPLSAAATTCGGNPIESPAVFR